MKAREPSTDAMASRTLGTPPSQGSGSVNDRPMIRPESTATATMQATSNPRSFLTVSA